MSRFIRRRASRNMDAGERRTWPHHLGRVRRVGMFLRRRGRCNRICQGTGGQSLRRHLRVARSAADHRGGLPRHTRHWCGRCSPGHVPASRMGTTVLYPRRLRRNSGVLRNTAVILAHHSFPHHRRRPGMAFSLPRRPHTDSRQQTPPCASHWRPKPSRPYSLRIRSHRNGRPSCPSASSKDQD